MASSSVARANHLALHRRQDDDVGMIGLDHADEEAAFLVMDPDIFAGVEAKIVVPESPGERIADDDDGRPTAAGVDEVAAAFVLGVDLGNIERPRPVE